MKKYLFYLLVIFLFNACTQIVTTPISVAGAVAGAAIDVTAATARAVAGRGDED